MTKTLEITGRRSEPITLGKEVNKIIVRENSRGVIIDKCAGGMELVLQEGSSLVFASMHTQGESESAISATLGKDASLNLITIDTSPRKLSVAAEMEGRGSSLQAGMMFFGNKDQKFEYDVSAVHKAPHTSSDIVSKGVLDGRARMSFNGLVRINRGAHGSSGNQREDTLLLSEEAEASPTPNLEIENNDVQCTHATTVGQVDKEKLFYIMSRGMEEEEATRLVVKGFLESFVSALHIKEMRDEVRGIVSSKLEEMT